jgi:hypothetical protein
MKRLTCAMMMATMFSLVPGILHAASENIDAVTTFNSGVTLGNELDMDFNAINYGAAPGVGDTVSLGTNGTIIYAGTFTGGGTGTAGRVDVTAGTNGQVVEVFCDTTATLSNGLGGTIDAALEVTPENATGVYGAGLPCNGVSGAAASSFTLNVGTLDTFVFGGQLDGGTAAGFAGGTYSTANPGGGDVQVDVFYQ